jgi:hypothetical protein
LLLLGCAENYDLALLGCDGLLLFVYFCHLSFGSTFLGGSFQTIASYANGNPMAIVQGSVGLIGCHLESQKHWYSKKVMQPHWHENTHHPLLWQFVANHLLQTQQMQLF